MSHTDAGGSLAAAAAAVPLSPDRRLLERSGSDDSPPPTHGAPVRRDHGADPTHRHRRHHVRRTTRRSSRRSTPTSTVKFEAITDYEGEVRIRMNTKDYGDVLLIPNSVDRRPAAELLRAARHGRRARGQKYRFVTEQAFEGKVYGLAITGNAQGFVYNKKVWQAGRHHRAAEDAGGVPRRAAGDQGQDRRDPALHQLQGRLAARPSGRATGAPSAPTRTPSTSWPRTTRRGPRARSTSSSTRCCTTR